MKHAKKRSAAPFAVPAFLLILALVCAMVGTGVLSKYTTQRVVANEVSYTDQLAESFKLLDVPAEQLEDGSYAVNNSSGAQPTSGFSYKLIPGITIPAAPYVEITGKTEIPAYLYLEVDNDGPVTLSFDSSWSVLSGTSGKKGGTVYTYNRGEALTGSDPEAVLTVQTFTIDELSPSPVTDEGSVKVYAYMIRKVGDKSAADTYSEAPAV